MSGVKPLYGMILGFLIMFSIVAPMASISQKTPPPGLPEVLEFEMLSLPWFPQSDKAAEVVAEQLSKVGIKVKLVRLESAVMYPRIMRTFDYDSYALAVSQTPNPVGMLLAFHSSEARPGGSNYWGYVNAEVDSLIDKALTARSESELKEYAWRIQEIVSKGPFIPLFVSQNIQIIRAEWKNYTLMSGGVIEVYNRWSLLYMYKSDKPEENVFRIAFPADILSTNPFMATDLRSLWVINLLYDPLVALDPNFKVIPWLAERWEVRDDGRTYVFYLRKDVRFHDGKPLTADDVVFTFKVGIGNKTARFAALAQFVESVEKVDDYTVMFKLSKPSYLFLLSLATNLVYIVPRHVWIDKPIDWGNPEPIGTGPFKWHSRKPGESIVLVRNPDYFVKGAPRISTIVVRVIPEAETRFLAIKRGEVDMERYSALPTLVPEAQKDPNLRVIVTPDIWLVYIAFNFRRFNDTRLFEAINYAINREEVVKKAVLGYGSPVYAILNKEWHGDLANRNVFFEYNPQKAIQILESIGYKYDARRGVMVYVGPPPTTPPATKAPAETPATTPATQTTTPVRVTEAPNVAVIALILVIVVIAVIALYLLRRR
ncbi:MAG: ABC transporter substrate-binding protein [Acidilobaceae archaeon]